MIRLFELRREFRVARAVLLAVALSSLGHAGRAAAQSFVPVVSAAIDDHVAFATGAAWVDYDLDGDLDLFVVTAFSANNDNALFRNDGGDTFTRVFNPLTEDGAETVCSTWADADNDGDLDAFVSGLDADGGTLYRSAAGVWSVDGASTLTDLAVKGTGCAWGDYDNDGHVDLMLTVLNGALGMTTADRLFHNNGDGTFTEVVSGPVVTSPGFHHHPTWSDFDGDGDLDLFVASGNVGSTGPDKMYRNQLTETASATFTPITTGVLATDARDSQVLSFADYDNDGDLDCYAINYTSVGNQLYRNDGAAFTKITSGAIVASAPGSHGVAWGDYDNDGDLDVYVARDNSQLDLYYRNNGNGTFTKITAGVFVTTARSNYGVAAGDYDGDGDLDLFVPTARSEGPGLLYRNDLAGGAHWVTFRLSGDPSNRSGIGAKVRVRSVIGGTPRWQLREISASTGYGGQNMLAAHFGLGDAAAIDTVRVEWPSGNIDVLTGVARDRYWNLKEGVTTLDAAPARVVSALEFAIAPQPARGSARLSFNLPAAGKVRITVHDAGGRMIAAVSESRAAGSHTVPVPGVAGARPGLYFVRIETSAGCGTRRMAVLR